MFSLKSKKGFTIVELVIVIAVIAILAAVLIPTFSTVINNAHKSSAVQEAKAALDVISMEENMQTVNDMASHDYYFVGKQFVYKYDTVNGLATATPEAELSGENAQATYIAGLTAVKYFAKDAATLTAAGVTPTATNAQYNTDISANVIVVKVAKTTPAPESSAG